MNHFTGFLKRGILTLLFLIFLVSGQPPAHGFDGQNPSKSQKVLMTNLAGLAAITVWGTANWDYFSSSPATGSEGWFSENTKEGGADKWGHFYFSYGLSHLLAGTFEDWGYSTEKSARLGALSSFAMMGYMELGDAFSDYGFSHEDMIMNLLGSAAGYFLYSHPSLSEKINFRIEYIPEFDRADVFTDYENMKFVMALKLNGFESIQDSFARHFELQLGYYTRGYSRDGDRERNIYLGIGLSLPEIFSGLSMPKISKFFTYFQAPYTYIPLEKDLND
ncbi:DUF2279 domain-containing protein [Desulfospira joergensenii]|uniref:DUF2279 domain-containing protein n=1 Tax=Desulfospira joergensenii TaxID=53329 RepID=UPI0004022332|nr:DUF2279 domain-containing protein [Desulfospira joergensenii]